MFRETLKGIGVGWMIVIGGLLLIVLIWVLTVAWAPLKGEGEARKIIKGDGNYRIDAYNKFYDDCASAQTTQGIVKVTKTKIRQAKKSGDTAELSRQQTNLQAQTNVLITQVNDYNANSHKSYTIAQFKASDLPFTIDTNQEISCGS